MAQVITLSHFYAVQDLTTWPDLFAKLEYAKGGNVATYPNVIEIDVTNGGLDDGKGIWKLENVEVDGVKGVYAWLDGEEKINDVMHGLRSAEDLVEMILTLREYNSRQRMQRDLQTGAAKEPLGEAGFDNKFQVHDPMSWAEAALRLMAFGDIEKDGKVVVKTSAEGLTSGVYTLTLIQEPDFLGVAVDLDGGPTFNYPRPHLRSAEEIVEVILKLHAMYSKGVRPRDFQYDFKDGSVVIASAKSATGTEVKLFENGLITITSPGFMKLGDHEAQAIVDGLVSLTDEAVQPFQDGK